MNQTRTFFRPVYVLLFTIACLGTSLYIYIDSYLKVQSAFRSFVLKNKLDQKQLLDTETWVLVLTMSVLVAIILAGLAIIFVYYQKMIQLYRLQQNFINGFTHELKTPIASIKIFLDTMMKHELGREESLKYLEYMRRDANRLGENVEEILNLARLEERSFVGDWETIDILSTTRGLIDKTPHLFEGGEIELLGEGTYPVVVDRKLMDMLLMNIITNAFRYNEANRKKLSIQFQRENGSIVINFTDNGIGLEKGESKKIFRKFYQVGKSVKGSGIGLYLVAQIVKTHKGSIKAYSDGPGKGTTFSLQLKRAGS